MVLVGPSEWRRTYFILPCPCRFHHILRNLNEEMSDPIHLGLFDLSYLLKKKKEIYLIPIQMLLIANYRISSMHLLFFRTSRLLLSMASIVAALLSCAVGYEFIFDSSHSHRLPRTLCNLHSRNCL